MAVHRVLAVMVLLALAVSLPVQAQVDAVPKTGRPVAEYQPSAADTSAAGLLAIAQDALRTLEQTPTEQERDIAYSQAVNALTALYQLHGCLWAKPPLKRLLREPECPEIHSGYSTDGRVALRLEPLQLRNPAFDNYTVYLCTLTSHSSLNLRVPASGQLQLRLTDGTVLVAETLGPEHALWQKVKTLIDTFGAPPELASGTARGFKQVFAVQAGAPGIGSLRSRISAVSLVWGNFEFNIPYYENEVELERPAAR